MPNQTCKSYFAILFETLPQTTKKRTKLQNKALAKVNHKRLSVHSFCFTPSVWKGKRTKKSCATSKIFTTRGFSQNYFPLTDFRALHIIASLFVCLFFVALFIFSLSLLMCSTFFSSAGFGWEGTREADGCILQEDLPGFPHFFYQAMGFVF